MATATYSIRVDWDADGNFAGTNHDITSNLIALECRRGRTLPIILPGRGPADAGILTLRLKNHTGLYSPFNSSGALYGNLVPGRKIQVRATSGSTYTVWQGVIEKIIPYPPRPGVEPEARIEALGYLSKLTGRGKKVSPAASDGDLTGTLIAAVLDAAGIASADYNLDVGQTTTSRWYVRDVDALTAIREIEDTELGFVFEANDGRITFHDRHHRLTAAASTTSQATFSDAAAVTLKYHAIEERDPYENIVNEVTAQVPVFEVLALDVLWTLEEGVSLGPGQSREWIASYPNNSASPGGAYVDEWTTPELGTDITATNVDVGTDIAVTTSFPAGTGLPFKGGNHMRVELTNNHASATASFTLIQARGTAVNRLDPVRVFAEDITSKTDLDLTSSYEFPGPWLPDSNTAQGYVDYIVSRFKDPLASLRLTIAANKSDALMVQALSREIGDRITVTANNSTGLGISADFFIESINHTVDMGARRHVTVWELSPADTESYWILGTSALDSTAILGF